MTSVGVIFVVGLAASPVCFANGFKSMANELSQAAKNAGMDRIAILPFTPVEGGGSNGGWSISEKLITQVVRAGKVQAVERSLLRDLMDEHHLAQTGMINPTALKKLGKGLSADGVVTGSFADLGQKAVVNARLINVETGVILAAVEREVDRDWSDASFQASAGPPPASMRAPAPEFTVGGPSLPSENLPEPHDAPADAVCDGAAERVDRFEEQILDLKARYWAAQLKNGASLADVKVNPGSTITDPLLKKAFYDRLRYWYGLERIPELTPSEMRRFVSTDGKAYLLYRDCGV